MLEPPPHSSIPLKPAPIAKVLNGTIAGAATVIIIYILRSKFNLDLPPEVDEALKFLIAGLLAIFANYLANYATPIKYRELK